MADAVESPPPNQVDGVVLPDSPSNPKTDAPVTVVVEPMVGSPCFRTQVLASIDLMITKHAVAEAYYNAYNNLSSWLRNLIAIGTSLTTATLVMQEEKVALGMSIVALVLSSILSVLTAWTSWVQPAVRATGHSTAIARYQDLRGKVNARLDTGEFKYQDAFIQDKLAKVCSTVQTLDFWMFKDCGQTGKASTNSNKGGILWSSVSSMLWHIRFARYLYECCGCCCAPPPSAKDNSQTGMEDAAAKASSAPPADFARP